MRKLFPLERLLVLIRRLFQVRKAATAFLLAGIVDIVVISIISIIYDKISEANYEDIVFFAFAGFLLVAFRTLSVLGLRDYSYAVIMKKKTKDERRLVETFIESRSYTLPINEASLISGFKEAIANATQLATINFDIPMSSLIGELVFAIGGIILLVYNIGPIAILAMTPVILILACLMYKIAGILRSYGLNAIKLNESRLTRTDNVAEASLELSAASCSVSAADYFEIPNKALNMLFRHQLTLSNSSQLIVESASFLMIMTCIIMMTLQDTSVSIGRTASSLAILARLIPTVTRTMSSVTQLNYGIPAVMKLHNYTTAATSNKILTSLI